MSQCMATNRAESDAGGPIRNGSVGRFHGGRSPQGQGSRAGPPPGHGRPRSAGNSQHLMEF
jgi:hypothetical protein